MREIDSELNQEFLRYQLAASALQLWHQGLVILQMHSASMAYADVTEFSRLLGRLADSFPLNRASVGALNKAHERYFLNSLAKFFRWVDKIRSKTKIEIPSDLALLCYKSLHKDARDMWKHSEDYLTGGRQHKSRFVWNRTYSDNKQVTADSTFSITIGSEYILANRIDVFAVTIAAKDTVFQLARAGFAPQLMEETKLIIWPDVYWFCQQWPPQCARECLERF